MLSPLVTRFRRTAVSPLQCGSKADESSPVTSLEQDECHFSFQLQVIAFQPLEYKAALREVSGVSSIRDGCADPDMSGAAWLQRWGPMLLGE